MMQAVKPSRVEGRRWGDKPCWRWQRSGTCDFGDRCWFSHRNVIANYDSGKRNVGRQKRQKP